jgi:hypothetical protein
MKTFACALLTACTAATEPNPPTWDTNSVKLITPSSDCQSIVNAVWFENGTTNPELNGQWSTSRYALMFTEGFHDCDVNVGYYTQVLGVGLTPTDTRIKNLWSPNGSTDYTVGALDNFWRGVENVTLGNANNQPVVWAVSQAAPMRRVVIDGDIDLFASNGGPAGYASGGYLADAEVKGSIYGGSQQQWFTRNSSMQKFEAGSWNYVFLGCEGAPASHCGREGLSPNSTVASTPLIAEKPYIVMEGNQWKLQVPNYEANKVGTTPNWQNAETRDFSNVFVARATDSAATINSKLAEGLDVLIQPGNYHLSESLKVNKAGQVILGIGMATLISTNGNALIEVGDVDSVRIAGLTLEAGVTKSDTLLKWGTGNFTGSASQPGVMTDVFARVGGPTNSQTTQVSTEVMVQINTNDIIIDHTWLWRADHDIGGLVSNSANYVFSGLQVQSDNVKAYGLFVEHTLGDMTSWNGNNGEVYFYQSELPYDVT